MASGPSDKGTGRGQRLGKYEVLAHIATGGMGAVYKAVDVDRQRAVALKVLSPEMAARPHLVERFRREARSAARLRHENIVALYELGEANGTYFLALEYVDGIDLHDLVSRKGPRPPEEARQIMIQAARALGHAFAHGIVHRDIKPSNFLVAERDGRLVVKLTDLGLARAVNEQEFRVTRLGTTVGTLDYMAPEQARDSQAADVRSDIYSLGCTFYHLLAGQCPFPRGSLSERLHAHLEAEPPDVRARNPAVSAELWAILQRMLAKQPEDRFQTPAELLQALEDLESCTVPAAPRFRWAAQELLQGLEDAEVEPGLLPLEGPAQAPAVKMPTPVPPSRPPATMEARLPPPEPPAPAREAPSGRRVRSPEDSEEKPTAKVKLRSAKPLPPRRRGVGGETSERAPVNPRPPAWRRWAAGCAGVAGAVVLGCLVFGGGEQPSSEEGPQTSAEKPAARRAPKAAPGDSTGTSKLPILMPGQAQPVNVRPDLPPLYPSRYGPDPRKVRADYEGPLATAPPADGPVYRVSRLPRPGANTYRSLGEALARVPADKPAILEIHDNGPLFEPAVGTLAGRTVVVRAGKGFRPLLAWDIGAAAETEESTTRLFAVDKGRLVLEDLDVVMKWSDSRGRKAPALFLLHQGELWARGCTFSLAGKHARGLTLARLEGAGPSRCRLSRCYARGGDLIALDVEDPGAEILVDDSLVVGGERPLCQVKGSQGPPPTLRLVRSTLVADKALLTVAPAAGVQRTPALSVLCCDSLLAQGTPGGEGILAHLATGVAADRIHWKAMNSVYAGWKLLLSANDRRLPATALEDWWRLWGYTERDKALLESWPPAPRAEPEDVAPAAYDTAGTPVHFAAISGAGAIGCHVAAAPASRPAWSTVTYDRIALALPDLPSTELPPQPPPPADGRYHGERVVLQKGFDLGRYLQEQLALKKPGPVVVLHLAGSGDHPTTPLRVQGAGLVLSFEKPEHFADPLTLTPSTAAGDQEALIQVDGGDLELRGARIVFPSSRFAAVPRHVLQVRGGNMRLAGCHLQGQLVSTNEAYQGLIGFDGSGKDTAPTPSCAVSECILLSGRTVFQLRQGGARLRLQQSLALAADDFLLLDLTGAPPRPNVKCSLEHNTLAVRRALIDVRGGAAGAVPDPAVIRADGNLFLAPFDGPGPSTLLRCDRACLAQGLLSWQGKGNGFDRQRLHSYVTVAGETPAGRQSFEAWAGLWGTPGERAPLLVDLPQGTFKLRPPPLRQLALPRSVRPQAGEALPGANLVRLGILAGKK
jgi:serine/threonine-protein kinase